jgi:hypothetical protein
MAVNFQPMRRIWIALDLIALVIGIASTLVFAIGLGWALWAAPSLAKWALACGAAGLALAFLLGPRIADKAAPGE